MDERSVRACAVPEVARALVDARSLTAELSPVEAAPSAARLESPTPPEADEREEASMASRLFAVSLDARASEAEAFREETDVPRSTFPVVAAAPSSSFTPRAGVDAATGTVSWEKSR
jgi:hypothetical protein